MRTSPLFAPSPSPSLIDNAHRMLLSALVTLVALAAPLALASGTTADFHALLAEATPHLSEAQLQVQLLKGLLEYVDHATPGQPLSLAPLCSLTVNTDACKHRLREVLVRLPKRFRNLRMDVVHLLELMPAGEWHKGEDKARFGALVGRQLAANPGILLTLPRDLLVRLLVNSGVVFSPSLLPLTSDTISLLLCAGASYAIQHNSYGDFLQHQEQLLKLVTSPQLATELRYSGRPLELDATWMKSNNHFDTCKQTRRKPLAILLAVVSKYPIASFEQSFSRLTMLTSGTTMVDYEWFATSSFANGKSIGSFYEAQKLAWQHPPQTTNHPSPLRASVLRRVTLLAEQASKQDVVKVTSKWLGELKTQTNV